MSVVPHVEQQMMTRLLEDGGSPVSSCRDSVSERESRRMSVVPHMEEGDSPASSCLDSVPEQECRRMSVVPQVQQ